MTESSQISRGPDRGLAHVLAAETLVGIVIGALIIPTIIWFLDVPPPTELLGKHGVILSLLMGTLFQVLGTGIAVTHIPQEEGPAWLLARPQAARIPVDAQATPRLAVASPTDYRLRTGDPGAGRACNMRPIPLVPVVEAPVRYPQLNLRSGGRHFGHSGRGCRRTVRRAKRCVCAQTCLTRETQRHDQRPGVGTGSRRICGQGTSGTHALDRSSRPCPHR